ncbi:Hypothetical_protein [Hexamita inflata]|uniref:Hypothetical_protein n=1 Tax=Hexamita inflata TaxID=28002 RepID=A0AA86U3Z0_9EUKA|nr:Hypothetical protein HINF_LOCUS7541 [Hexamita inflata]CAI9937092.1 Hypothetical protein HINF_LOCUS24737 [Hexamita inflata]
MQRRTSCQQPFLTHAYATPPMDFYQHPMLTEAEIKNACAIPPSDKFLNLSETFAHAITLDNTEKETQSPSFAGAFLVTIWTAQTHANNAHRLLIWFQTQIEPRAYAMPLTASSQTAPLAIVSEMDLTNIRIWLERDVLPVMKTRISSRIPTLVFVSAGPAIITQARTDLPAILNHVGPVRFQALI